METINNHDIENAVSKTVIAVMNQFMVQQSEALYNIIDSMLQSKYGIMPMNLENYTNGTQKNLLSVMEGADQMAYKYRERVDVVVDGQPVKKWACGNTREELQKAIFDICVRYGKYSIPAMSTGNDRLWDEYAWEWFNTYKVPCFRSSKTASTRKCFMKKYVVPAFGDKSIASITRRDIQEALNRNSHLSKAYMRDIMNYMKGIFKAAMDDDIIRKNPMDSDMIRNPCKRESFRKALTEEEQADIIFHIPRLKKEIDRAFMALLMFTSLRPGEIYALRWEDIDFENNLIHVMRGSSFDNGKILMGEDGETKTGWKGVRTVELHSPLKEYLVPLKKESGYVLSRDSKGHEGEPFSEQAYKCQWERIKKQIDVHGMTPYVGRHTYLTEVVHNGVSIDTAAKIGGHTDTRMLTRHYLHANDKQVKAAGQTMEDFFKRLATSCD